MWCSLLCVNVPNQGGKWKLKIQLRLLYPNYPLKIQAAASQERDVCFSQHEDAICWPSPQRGCFLLVSSGHPEGQPIFPGEALHKTFKMRVLFCRSFCRNTSFSRQENNTRAGYIIRRVQYGMKMEICGSGSRKNFKRTKIQNVFVFFFFSEISLKLPQRFFFVCLFLLTWCYLFNVLLNKDI